MPTSLADFGDLQRAWPGYGNPVIALLFVALVLGLSNFAAAIGIGISGVDARARLRVGVLFGLFETGMPIVGWPWATDWPTPSARPRTGSAPGC